MNILESMKQKTSDFEKNFGPIKGLKAYKFFYFFEDEITKMASIYTKKQQFLLLVEATGANFKYQTFIQYLRSRNNKKTVSTSVKKLVEPNKNTSEIPTKEEENPPSKGGLVVFDDTQTVEPLESELEENKEEKEEEEEEELDILDKLRLKHNLQPVKKRTPEEEVARWELLESKSATRKNK